MVYGNVVRSPGADTVVVNDAIAVCSVATNEIGSTGEFILGRLEVLRLEGRIAGGIAVIWEWIGFDADLDSG